MEPDLSKMPARALVGALVTAKLEKERFEDMTLEMFHARRIFRHCPDFAEDANIAVDEAISDATVLIHDIGARLDRRADLLLKEIYRRIPE